MIDNGSMPAWLPAVWQWSAAPRRWPGLLAALLIAGLLVAFHQVVSGGVTQAETRRAQALAQAEAAQHCQGLNSARQRQACLAGMAPMGRTR